MYILVLLSKDSIPHFFCGYSDSGLPLWTLYLSEAKRYDRVTAEKVSSTLNRYRYHVKVAIAP